MYHKIFPTFKLKCEKHFVKLSVWNILLVPQNIVMDLNNVLERVSELVL